jgi:hypothetical protein
MNWSGTQPPWLFLKSGLTKVLRLHKVFFGLRFQPICMAKRTETAAKKKAIELCGSPDLVDRRSKQLESK